MTSWPRTCAKPNSMPSPTTYETAIIGSTLRKPNQNEAQNSGTMSCERKCWYPTLYMPNNSAGINATTTIIIVRFMSLQSRIWAPRRVVVFGTKRNVSKASNVDSKKPNLPPLANVGLILSTKLRIVRIV